MRTRCHKMLTCNIYALLLVCCCCCSCCAAAAAAASFAPAPTTPSASAASNSQQHNHYRVRHQHQQLQHHHLLRQTTKTTTSLPAAHNGDMRPERLAPTPPSSSPAMLLKLTPVQYFTSPNGRTHSFATDNRIHLADDAGNRADEWNDSKHDRAAKRLHDQQRRLWPKPHHQLHHSHRHQHPNFAHSHLHHRKHQHQQHYRHQPHSATEDRQDVVDDDDDDDHPDEAEVEDDTEERGDASPQHNAGTGGGGGQSEAHHLINLQPTGSRSGRTSQWNSGSTAATEKTPTMTTTTTTTTTTPRTTTAINSASKLAATESLRVGGQRASHISLSPARPVPNNGAEWRAGQQDGADRRWNWSWDPIGDNIAATEDPEGDNDVNGAKKVHLNVDVDDGDGDVSFTTQKPSGPTIPGHSAAALVAANDITSTTERFVSQLTATSGNKFEQIPLNDSTAAPPLMTLLRQLLRHGDFSISSQATEQQQGGVFNERQEAEAGADSNRSSQYAATEAASVADDADADDFDDIYDDAAEDYVAPEPDSNVPAPVDEWDDDLESVDQNEVNADYAGHRERAASEEVDFRKVPDDYDTADYPGDVNDLKWDTLGSEAAVNRTRAEYFANRAPPEMWDNRARIDWLLSNLTSSELNDLAQAHMKRIRRCMRPMSRIVHLNGTDPRLRYLPHCIELHRCGNDAGCCGQDDMSCVASKTEEVDLYFQTMHVSTGLIGYDIRTFTNHTECQCMPNNGNADTFAPAAAARSVAANCVCVQHYEVFNDTQVVAGGGQQPDAGCYCGCRAGNEQCRELSNGRQEFSVADRRCVRTSKCRRPFCEHGSYNMTSGSCPTVEQKRNRLLHRDRG